MLKHIDSGKVVYADRQFDHAYTNSEGKHNLNHLYNNLKNASIMPNEENHLNVYKHAIM